MAGELTGFSAMLPPQVERRAAARFELSLPVAVRSPEGAFQTETALCHNVSSCGIFFLMTQAVSAGMPIEFTVTLPPEITLSDAMRVNCKGRVVRVVQEPHGYGVGATIEGYLSFIRLSSRPNLAESGWQA